MGVFVIRRKFGNITGGLLLINKEGILISNCDPAYIKIKGFYIGEAIFGHFPELNSYGFHRFRCIFCRMLSSL